MGIPRIRDATRTVSVQPISWLIMGFGPSLHVRTPSKMFTTANKQPLHAAHARHAFAAGSACKLRPQRPYRNTTVVAPVMLSPAKLPTCKHTITHVETCVRRLHAAWGVTICRSILPLARGCRVGVWFGFVRAALLPAVGTCVVLAFGAMPGRCCFLRVTLSRTMHMPFLKLK